jgi:peroxiredoxin Q/BCP
MTLEPGDMAPDWTLPTAAGETLSLASLRGNKVILYAYPAAMTPGCTTQACDFRDNQKALTEAGYRIVGLSPDSPAKLAEFAAHDGITFPLLSDESRKTLKAYGAYFQRERGGRVLEGVVRSTFVIGADGLLEQVFYNVNPQGHVSLLREALLPGE